MRKNRQTMTPGDKSDQENDRVVIRQVSDMAHSITDGADSVSGYGGNILDRELNLTEYEKQVRREAGIISEENQTNSSHAGTYESKKDQPLHMASNVAKASNYTYQGTQLINSLAAVKSDLEKGVDADVQSSKSYTKSHTLDSVKTGDSNPDTKVKINSSDQTNKVSPLDYLEQETQPV